MGNKSCPLAAMFLANYRGLNNLVEGHQQNISNEIYLTGPVVLQEEVFKIFCIDI